MSRPILSSDERVLRRAWLRFHTGQRKPFVFREKKYSFEIITGEDGGSKLVLVVMSEWPGEGKWLPLSSPDPDVILEAINSHTVQEIMNS
jgi:hypothetical protein